MKRIITTFVAVPALLAASATVAQEAERPNYKFFELDYVYSSVDLQSPSINAQAQDATWYVPNGLKLSGSWVFVEQLLIRGSYFGGSGELKKTEEINLTTATASIGYLPRTTDATGIDLSLDYRQDEIELKGQLDEKIKGPGVSFGIRTAPSPRTELGLRGGWYEGDYNGAVAFNVSFGFNFTDRFGLNAYWERIDTDPEDSLIAKYELNQAGVGARVYF